MHASLQVGQFLLTLGASPDNPRVSHALLLSSISRNSHQAIGLTFSSMKAISSASRPYLA